MGENGKAPPAWRDLLTEAVLESGTKKQAAVLIAAAELFSQKGYAATTTKEIARLAGVSEGALFKYFATKDALFERLSELLAEKVFFFLFSYDLEEIMAEGFSKPQDLFKRLLRNRLELIDSNLIPIRLLLQELPYRPGLRANFLETLQRLPFWRILEDWRRRGLLRDMPSRDLFLSVISCLCGFLLSRILVLPAGFVLDREQDIENFVDFIAHGLAPQGAAASCEHEEEGEGEGGAR
jgi:AcrR family transcriptional regulator